MKSVDSEVNGSKPSRAQRGAKKFHFAFAFRRKLKLSARSAERIVLILPSISIRKLSLSAGSAGAKTFLHCSRGQGVPRGRLIFGGRLIVSGARGHLADVQFLADA